MSALKRCLCLLVGLLLILSAAACASSGGSAATPPPSPFAINEANLPKDAAGIALVARVNNAEITLPDYQRLLQRYQQQPTANPGQLPKIVLQTMIQQSLIDQAAASVNIVVTDAEVDTELKNLMSSAGGADKWQQWLKNNDYTETELRHTLHETLLTNRMRDHLTSDLNGPVPQVHARHILVATQQEANDLLLRLRNGEDFAKLAQQYSLDKLTGANGGDLGWFMQEELLEPALAKVAFQLKPGQIAGPVKTSLGYHIIQTLERADRPIDADKRVEIAQNRFENWLSTLAGSAKIEQFL